MAKKSKSKRAKTDWANWSSSLKKSPGRKLARRIDIDVEVHKRIESARLSFNETENVILRRLLGMDGDQLISLAEAPVPGTRATGGGVGEGGWSKTSRNGRNVFLPNGTKLRAAYAGKEMTGDIKRGMWVVEGQKFTSPSAALNAFARTHAGETVNLNGWRHWEVRVPGAQTWIRLGKL